MADPASYRPAPGSIPESPGVYRFRDERGRVIYVGKAKSLRSRLNSYFADFAGLHPRTQSMLRAAAAGRLDRGGHRGRGAPARVLLDQGVRPAVQRPVPGRQELPVPGRDDERGVPAGPGHARGQAPRRPLLRAVLARLGDPGHRRHAAAGLPGPHLLGRGLQAGRPDRPALPARLHRQVLGAVRGPDRRRRAPAAGRGVLRLHGRPDGQVHQAARGRDARGGRGGGVRARRPAARRHPGAAAGAGEAGRGAAGRHRLRRDRAGRGSARGRRPGLLRARRPGPRPARLGRGQGRGHHDRRSWSSTSSARSTTRTRSATTARGSEPARRGIPREVLVPALPPDAAHVEEWLGDAARRPGQPPGAAARRQEGAAGHRGPQRRRVAGAAQDPPGQRPDHPQRGAERDPGGARRWTRRRCGSRATTSRTCRARTSSRPWSSSRTAWPASRSTAGSRSRAWTAPTTWPPSTR